LIRKPLDKFAKKRETDFRAAHFGSFQVASGSDYGLDELAFLARTLVFDIDLCRFACGRNAARSTPVSPEIKL
jgi:hypothetical protein